MMAQHANDGGGGPPVWAMFEEVALIIKWSRELQQDVYRDVR